MKGILEYSLWISTIAPPFPRLSAIPWSRLIFLKPSGGHTISPPHKPSVAPIIWWISSSHHIQSCLQLDIHLYFRPQSLHIYTEFQSNQITRQSIDTSCFHVLAHSLPPRTMCSPPPPIKVLPELHSSGQITWPPWARTDSTPFLWFNRNMFELTIFVTCRFKLAESMSLLLFLCLPPSCQVLRNSFLISSYYFSHKFLRVRKNSSG